MSTPSSFTKAFENWRAQTRLQQEQKLAEEPKISKDDCTLGPSVEKQNTLRRWSYVTYLNDGTYYGDGDNLMLGL